MKRLVITGGAGFVGSHLCERMLLDGHEVVCVDNLLTGAKSNIEHLRQYTPFSFIQQDVTLDLKVEGQVDTVMHFASPASPLDYLRHPIATMRVGSIGTMRALELAQYKGARFVLASTSETYGSPLVHPQPETYWGNVNPVGPRAVYDEAKRFSEALTVAYRSEYQVDTLIVRIFNTFGPRMRADDGRAIPTFIHQALTGAPITVTGSGLQTRSLIYVDDLVEAISRAVTSDAHGPINLGNPHEISMIELAEWIKRLTSSQSPIIFIDRPKDDPEIRRPDISLARKLLSWEPAVPVQQGLLQTIEWMSQQSTNYREPQASTTRTPSMTTITFGASA